MGILLEQNQWRLITNPLTLHEAALFKNTRALAKKKIGFLEEDNKKSGTPRIYYLKTYPYICHTNNCHDTRTLC